MPNVLFASFRCARNERVKGYSNIILQILSPWMFSEIHNVLTMHGHIHVTQLSNKRVTCLAASLQRTPGMQKTPSTELPTSIKHTLELLCCPLRAATGEHIG